MRSIVQHKKGYEIYMDSYKNIFSRHCIVKARIIYRESNKYPYVKHICICKDYCQMKIKKQN